MRIRQDSMINKRFNKLFIKDKISIKEALFILNNNKLRTLIVVGKNDYFKGTLSEGDIRRAIIRNFNLTNSIEKIFNKKPFVFKESKLDISKVNFIIKENYDFVPVVKNKKVVDIIFQKEIEKVFSLKKKNMINIQL